MEIQVNSDKNIQVDSRVTQFVQDEANRALTRFADRLTRIEVHLSDVNSGKFGKQDKRCLIEARPAGQRPLAVTIGAATVESAVRGSLIKLRKALETSFGRASQTRTRGRRGEVQRVPARTPTKKTAAKKTASSNPASRSAARKTVAAASPKGIKRERAATQPRAEKGTAKKTVARKKAVAKRSADAEAPSSSGRSAKKKGIYQARRKSFPKR